MLPDSKNIFYSLSIEKKIFKQVWYVIKFNLADLVQGYQSSVRG